MRRLLVLSLVAATVSGCAGLTPNHTRGLAAVGGVAVLAGSLTLVDGWSCDERSWLGGDCTHDSAELRNGALLTTAGAALLSFAIWRITHDGDEVAPRAPTRAARTASPRTR